MVANLLLDSQVGQVCVCGEEIVGGRLGSSHPLQIMGGDDWGLPHPFPTFILPPSPFAGVCWRRRRRLQKSKACPHRRE